MFIKKAVRALVRIEKREGPVWPGRVQILDQSGWEIKTQVFNLVYGAVINRLLMKIIIAGTEIPEEEGGIHFAPNPQEIKNVTPPDKADQEICFDIVL